MNSDDICTTVEDLNEDAENNYATNSVAKDDRDNLSDAEYVTCDLNPAVESISVEITTTENGSANLNEPDADQNFAESEQKNIKRNNSTQHATELKPINLSKHHLARNFTESKPENSDGNYSELIIAESEQSILDRKYSAKSSKNHGKISEFSIEITTNSEVGFNDENLSSKKFDSENVRTRKEYKCRFCGKIFNRKLDMHVHRLTHIKKENRVEDDPSRPNVEPNNVQNTKDDFIDDTVSERQAQRLEFQAFEPSDARNTYDIIIDDMTSEHEAKMNEFQCSQCNRTFWTVTQFEEHQKIHCEQTGLVFRCKLCESGFFTKEDLDLHELMHANYQNFKCLECGCEFQRSFSDENEDFRFLDLNSFKCEQCGLKSSQLHSFNFRSPKPGDKPFKCHICGNTFTRRGNLQRHELIHTKLKETNRSEFVQNRTFPCSTCGTTFSRRGNLQRHELIHTSQKPYKCHCGKAFTQPSHLKAHGITHTKERPFECAECGMTFTRKGNLKRHVQLHEEKNRSM